MIDEGVERSEPKYGDGMSNSIRSMVVPQVIARAGRKCQACGLRETQERGKYLLHIHHIDGDDTNNSFNNLRLLCSRCHTSIHRGFEPGKPVAMPSSLERGMAEMRRSTHHSQKIMRVTDALIRKRIEKITPKSCRLCAKYLYIIDGRVSEAVSRAFPSDTETTPRGPVGSDAKIEVYYPPHYRSFDEALRAQRDDGVKRVYPAAIFTVATAKRRGRPRYCAVPIEPKMEPWAMELMKYFEEHGNDAVFPITRQRVWERSKKVWRDLVYVIEDYSVVLNKGGTGIENISLESTTEKRRSKRVDRHPRDWTLHALRHLRASDLVDHYGFTGANLSSFGGWTIGTSMRVSSSVGRYLDLDWRGYFPKLLKHRY
jgi:hypothetical protein